MVVNLTSPIGPSNTDHKRNLKCSPFIFQDKKKAWEMPSAVRLDILHSSAVGINTRANTQMSPSPATKYVMRKPTFICSFETECYSAQLPLFSLEQGHCCWHFHFNTGRGRCQLAGKKCRIFPRHLSHRRSQSWWWRHAWMTLLRKNVHRKLSSYSAPHPLRRKVRFYDLTQYCIYLTPC